MYDPKSLKADEFIDHQEILDTLQYAEEHKHDVALIDSILEKARPQKTATGYHCAGLTHREASVLLACDIPEKIEEMYRLAEEIKARVRSLASVDAILEQTAGDVRQAGQLLQDAERAK